MSNPPLTPVVESAPPTNLSARRFGELVFILCLLPILAAMLLTSLFEPFWEYEQLLFGALAVAGLAWLVSVQIARAGGGSLAVIVVGAICLRAIVLVGPTSLSDDLYRYVWEGELVASQTSPYAYAPEAPELAAQRERLPEVFARMNNTDISAAYPPAVQLVFAATTSVAKLVQDPPESSGPFAMRILFALCDLLVLWPLIALLRRFKLPPSLSVVWAWNPLIALEFAGSGHFDSLGILLFVAALSILTLPSTMRPQGIRARLFDAFGTSLLSAAILVKFLPICIVPFVLRGAFLRRSFFLLLSSAALIAPFAFFDGAASGLTRGISEYGVRWESFHFVYGWIEWIPEQLFGGERDLSPTDPRIVARGFIALVWCVVGLFLFAQTRNTLRAATVLIGLFLVLTPTLHPWYLAWIAPFVALKPRASWLWVLLVGPALYVPLRLWKTEGVWTQPEWLWPVVAVPFLVFTLVEWRSDFSFRRRAHQQAATAKIA